MAEVGLASWIRAANWFATKPLKLTRKDSTVRRKRWIRAFALTLTAVLPVVPALISPTVAVGADDSIQRLVSTITSKSSSDDDRNEAALRLIRNDSQDARAAAQSCLKDAGKPFAQASIAKAVYQSSNPDPALIPLLAQLLGSSETLSFEADRALANYRGNREAFNQLTHFIDIPQTPNVIRTHAIRAMGSLIDRSAAEYLINLSSTSNQSPAIQDAATSALAELTGISNFGSDPRQWQQWWTNISGKNQDQFQAMLLEIRIGHFNQAKQRDHDLFEQTSKLLSDYYYTAPDEKKTGIVLKYLNNTSPDIRSIGVGFFKENNLLKPDPSVRKRLFAMIDDADDTVRLEVIAYLKTLNDPVALHPLIDQLSVEKDLQIKRMITQAFANLEDPAAVPALLKLLLQDPQNEAKTAAAKALSGRLGAKVRQANPALADQASQQIRDLLETNVKQSGTDNLRAACLFALAALRDKRSFDTFNQYLQPGQTNEVRRAALQGLGNLNDTNADDIVASQLRENNDKTVRLEAAKAMQTVATPQQADRIFNRMNNDPDQEVRDALWVAFQNLYPKESPEDLERWQAQFNNDPNKKLVTLKKLGDALRAKGDKENVAVNQQRLADALLAVNPPRTPEAIDNLQAALDYWRGPGKGGEVQQQTLVEQLMDAQLTDGRYTDAVAFAAKQIAIDPAYQGALSLKIVDKADNLLRTNTPASLTGAQTLITETQKMSPPLDQHYSSRMQAIQTDLKQRAGAAPAP